MLGNYLAAALRNLTRNRLYASVTIAGLAIGFAAAMLIGLYVRDEFTFDRFIPGHERVYRISQTLVFKGARPIETDFTPMMLARPFKEDFPEVAALARLTNSYFPPALRRGETAAPEANFYWADPDFFRVLPLPVVAGDLTRALEAPDSVVLTRALARKYFGRDAPVGESLTVNGQPMRVTAVIEDLPSNTHLPFEALGSSLNAMSPISQYEDTNGPLTNTLATYFRLRDGASVASMEPRLGGFLERRLPVPASWDTGPVRRKLHLVPLADIHMRPSTHGAYKPAGQPAVVAAIGGVGLLIVVVAGINFVTLMTARATRRAVEVGVRKVAGASRRDLFWQFMGEAGLYVLLAGVLAVALAELTLPAFNAFLQRRIGFDYLGDPWLAAALAGVLLVTALLAGLYPALVLSSFRPAAVLKGASPAVGGAGLRQVLVVVQFAVLIGLVLATITIARQTLFALNEGMRVDTDQVVLVFSPPCLTAMRDEVRKLPGVRDAACAESGALNLSDATDTVVIDGRRASISTAGVDFGLLELFGVEPLAGRFFDRDRPADQAVERADAYPPVVINESAMRKLGFVSPQQAVGRTVVWHGLWDDSLRGRPDEIPTARPSEIIGVAPDFTFGSMRSTIQPTLFSMSSHKPPLSVALAIKLDGRTTPETLAGIDRLWDRYGGGRPILRVFADQFTMRLYLDTLTQGATIALAAIIALSIACLGLFALSAYTTERRTKEIGIRKAMGASSTDVLKLLVWQFTKPVLLANIIAWPLAWLAMNSWLNGFAYRVDVAPWTFAAAAGAALLIAWTTVVFHALKVARAKPVGALRYE